MHLAALAAGLVTVNAASAFLIPPTTSLPNLHNTEKEVTSDIARIFGLDRTWQVELDCPNCAWGGVEDIDGTPVQWSRQYETSLQIEIDADRKNGLLINNVATSVSASNGPQAVSLYATQKRLDNGDTTPPFPIDFVIERLEPVSAPEDPSQTIIPIKFTIVGFAGLPVQVDTLAIDILQTRASMAVMRVDKVPFASTPGAASCSSGDDSAWSLCRVRAIVLHRVMATMRGMRDQAHRAKGWVGTKVPCRKGGVQQHSTQQHTAGGRYHYHHSHHRAHRWAKMLRSTLRFFIIPALLGVIGGLLASAVGMLVGQLIVLLWMRFARRGRRGSASSQRRGGEKDGLLLLLAAEDAEEEDGVEEALPRYEHAPRYEDVEALERRER